MDKQKEKQYVIPEFDIIVFQNEDIILTSGGPAAEIPDENEVP